MIYKNVVSISGRTISILTKTTKNGKEYVVLGVVTHRYNGDKNDTTYISVMVFNERLINYIRSTGVGKGYPCVIDGFISNTQVGNIKNAITIVATDISFVIKPTNDDEEPTTENAIMEDYNEYDF